MLQPDYIAELDALLKYAAETSSTVHALSKFLNAEPEARWGSPHSDLARRNLLADALEEDGRQEEAELLRDYRKHVIVHDGYVKSARFTLKPLHAALRQYGQLLGYDPLFEPGNEAVFLGHPDAEYVLLDHQVETHPALHSRTPHREPLVFIPHEDQQISLSGYRGLLTEAAENEGMDWAHRQDHRTRAYYNQLVDAIKNAPIEEPIPPPQKNYFSA